jgi:hypothetical protein
MNANRNKLALINRAALVIAGSAVAITAISSMPAANAQRLDRNTPARQMEDCFVNATKISTPNTDMNALRASCCASAGGKWYPPDGGSYAGMCEFPDGSTWFGRPDTPPANSTVILHPGATNTNIN